MSHGLSFLYQGNICFICLVCLLYCRTILVFRTIKAYVRACVTCALLYEITDYVSVAKQQTLPPCHKKTHRSNTHTRTYKKKQYKSVLSLTNVLLQKQWTIPKPIFIILPAFALTVRSILIDHFSNILLSHV